MGATFGRDLGGGEEHVHQERLAAPDLAVDIEPARRGLRAKQPAKNAAHGQPIALQLRGEAVELFDQLGLRGIGRDPPFLQRCCISVMDSRVNHF